MEENSTKRDRVPSSSSRGYETDSDSDEYLRDVKDFLRSDFRSHVTHEELHWTDIGWDQEPDTSPGWVGSLSDRLARLTMGTVLKLKFTTAVLIQFFKVWAVSAGQALLPWYFVLTMPPLIAWRVYTYSRKHQQYFCLDYCYFGNLAIFLILLFFPGSPQLFILQFCLANGLLYTGAFSFRNSLVFHSIDKMTSTYIHSAPVLLAFGIRWFPEAAGRYWHSSFPRDFHPWSFQWNVIAPLLFCIAHQCLYTVLVYGILKPEEHIITSFRYLKARASTKAIFGPSPHFTSFLIVQIAIVLLMSGVTILSYTYFWANVLQVGVLITVVTWNGANYYVDVFRLSLTDNNKKKHT